MLHLSLSIYVHVACTLCLVQLGRVARVLTTRPSFTKRLSLVLKAVTGLVEPSSPTFLTEKMLVRFPRPDSFVHLSFNAKIASCGLGDVDVRSLVVWLDP